MSEPHPPATPAAAAAASGRSPRRPADSPQPLAALLALLLPGAGHFYLGHRRRGVLVAVSILGLFFSGLLIGGIDSVDSRENRIWFFGQTLVGPITFAVDAIHQSRFKVLGPTISSIETNRVPEQSDPVPHYTAHYENHRRGAVLRAAAPFEIRGPDGYAVPVRDPRYPAADPRAPLTFTDPATKLPRLSTLADRPPYVQALGRASELGTLFATIAGMLNLICIIDAAYHHRKTQ